MQNSNRRKITSIDIRIGFYLVRYFLFEFEIVKLEFEVDSKQTNRGNEDSHKGGAETSKKELMNDGHQSTNNKNNLNTRVKRFS